MIVKQSTVKLPSGLHALNVGRLKSIVDNSKCSVFIRYHNKTVNCKDLISLLRLKLKKGAEVDIYCDGIGEEEIIEKVISFLENDKITQ